MLQYPIELYGLFDYVSSTPGRDGHAEQVSGLKDQMR